MSRFEGKVALVTGAASGMGRATCVRMAAEGASVYAVDINDTGLAGTADQIEGTGGKIETSVIDVTDREQCFRAVEASVAAFGQLNILVNVAGIVRFCHSHEMSEREWNTVLAVNLSGPMFLSQASIPHLIKSAGNIVNVASSAGIMGQAYTVAYCASKGGLIQATKAMAMEYMKQPIRINVVCPGGTETEMVEGVNFPEDADPELLQRIMGVRGIGQAEDVASAIAYIASDEAKMVHGSVFSVDLGAVAG